MEFSFYIIKMKFSILATFFLCFYLLPLLHRCFNYWQLFFLQGQSQFSKLSNIAFYFVQYFLINSCTYICTRGVFLSTYLVSNFPLSSKRGSIREKIQTCTFIFFNDRINVDSNIVWNPVNRRNLATIILLHASLDIFLPCLFFHVFIFSKNTFSFRIKCDVRFLIDPKLWYFVKIKDASFDYDKSHLLYNNWLSYVFFSSLSTKKKK